MWKVRVPMQRLVFLVTDGEQARHSGQLRDGRLLYYVILFSTFHLLLEFKDARRFDIAPEYKRRRFRLDLGRILQNGASFSLRLVCFFSPMQAQLQRASVCRSGQSSSRPALRYVRLLVHCVVILLSSFGNWFDFVCQK